jgi:APA family basic amino acid/polyamine antiporter
VACFIWGGETTDNINSFSPPVTTPLFVAIIIALQAVIYTYDGWAGVIYFSEEVRHPERSIPRAIFAGTLSVMGIYLLVNLALLYVLPITRIAGADLAAGVAAEVIWGKKADTIIRALTILSMLSSVNAYQLMATRVLFGMSRDQLFFHQAVKVNQGGTPSVALWISTAIAISFILSGTFNQVLAVLAFFFVASYTISFISLFVLRWREPQRARPYHAWGYPWTTALVLCGSVAFLIGAIISDTQNSVYALILLAVSYPIFCLFLRQ